MAYQGSVELISGIRQKNNGDFPLVDAAAVRVTDEERLDAVLAKKLGTEELESAISDVLTQAKESGDFNGTPGEKGEDGHTPVKGTDYWTESDKAEIVAEVLNALPAAEKASF